MRKLDLSGASIFYLGLLLNVECMENIVESKFAPNLDIDLLLPRANNIRRIIKPSVKAAITKTIRDLRGLPNENALLVRPIDNGKYETISGNTRLMVAREEGLKTLPAWIREMTDDEAFFETAKANSHGELTPIEYGLAGLNIPQSKGGRGRKGSISRYAEDIGYDVGAVRRWITCARVLKELGLDEDAQIGKFNDSTTHLYWISTAQREDWELLIEEVRKGISVDGLRALILPPKKSASQDKSVKDISDILPVKDVKQGTKNAVYPDADSNKQKEVAVIIPQISSIDSQVINNELQEQFQDEYESKDNLDWIKSISILGTCSIEQDQGKSNYQAGTDFEDIAKKGLEFLGFTVDFSHKGGSGGLDILCLKPYPLFGECKAGKSIPNDTVVQLLNLGTIRRNDLYQKIDTVKLIIGSGKPTPQVIDGANVHKMTIMNSMALQKLVELKAKYNSAINLFELKQYLQVGQINNKIDEYIQKVEGEIKLRSRIVQAVKKLADMGTTQANFERICTQYNAMFFTDNESILHDQEVKDLLIELSSPLAGYLGRVKSKERNGDRFYYLRDLPTTEKET
jgi:ParB-like chromosome segregation protein Spo0J